MAKKNGTGIRETAPGKFVASYYDPRVKGNTRHVGTFTGPPQPNPAYKTRAQAEKAAKTAKAQAEKQRDLELKANKSGETIETFAKRWPRDYPRDAPTTNRHNAERVRALIRDFGDRPLDGISAIEARAWIFGGIVPEEIRSVAKKWDKAKLHKDGDVEVPSRKGHHLVVRAMFNDAVRTGLVGTNPFSSLKVPEAPGRRGDAISVLEEPELALLVKTAIEVLGDEMGQHLGALFMTLAWTGMRPGEAWALNIEESSSWNYPDFPAGEIHVKYQIDRFSNKRRPKWDKKGKGRAVFMLPPAETALKLAMRDPDGGLRPDGPVFYTTRGLRLTGRNIGYYWDQIRPAFWKALPASRRSKLSEKEGGPEHGKIAVDFDLYELRHFFGTQLADMGLTPPEIADQMGHKDGGELAMRLYIHPRKESVKRSMLERFAEHERRKVIGGSQTM